MATTNIVTINTTYIDAAAATTSHDSNTDCKVGNVIAGLNEKRSICKFSPGSILGSVTAATLTLTVSNSLLVLASQLYDVFLLLVHPDFTSTSWNMYDSTHNWASAGASTAGTDYYSSPTVQESKTPSSGSTISFDVTTLVQQAMADGLSSIELLIKWHSDTGGVVNEFEFSPMGMQGASAPLLSVTYTTTTTPTLATPSVTPADTTASATNNVTSDGGASVTARGICWSTSSNPTAADSHTSDGTGTGAYSSSITGLSINTSYHARSYATNSIGTAYSADVAFTTNSVPTVTTANAASVTSSAATLGGNVTASGGDTVTEKGVVYCPTATSSTPHIGDAGVTKLAHATAGTGSWTDGVSSLSGNTAYTFAAYGRSSAGDGYGSYKTFTTDPTPLTVIHSPFRFRWRFVSPKKMKRRQW